jgi:hypothetical protein
MKLRYLMLLSCLACAASARADIYKSVDADGNVTYSNTPIKGGKKMDLDPLPTMPAYKENEGESIRVKQAAQKNRDEARRKILEGELADEERLLAEARQNLKDVQDNPRMARSNNVTYVLTEAQNEALKAAQEQVTLHEKNVAAIQQELSRLK